MTYRFKDDGRNLIPIREIESQILCDDPKAARVFRNFLLNALTSGKINPRNEYGFEVESGSLSRVTEIAVEKLADSILRESRPRSIADIVITPAEAKKLAKERLDKVATLNEKEFVLMGYLTKEDITSFLAGHRIACEWVPPKGATETTATTIEQAAEPQSKPEIANAAQSDSLSTSPRIVIHDTKKRHYPLDDAIDKAISEHGFVTNSIWTALLTWARSTPKPFRDLIGFTDEGIQYIGKNYQATDEYDILTLKQLSERIRKRKKAAEKVTLIHSRPPQATPSTSNATRLSET